MFTILCAARSGEVFGATWDEIDLDAGVWTVPPDRMKAARPHRVPLSAPAVGILRGQFAERGQNPHVFPGARPHQPLSVMALTMAMRRLGAGEFTPPWVQVRLPRLGGRQDQLPARDRRSRTGARCWRRN